MNNYIKYDLHNADILLTCAVNNAVYALVTREINEINLGRNITFATLSKSMSSDWIIGDPKISDLYNYELVLTKKSSEDKIIAKGNLFGEIILYRV